MYEYHHLNTLYNLLFAVQLFQVLSQLKRGKIENVHIENEYMYVKIN